LSALAAAPVPAAAATPEAPSNIVFILADDLGYGEVSFHGQARFRTPHIDRIAREGLAFRHAYAGSPICAPSRNALMTGHHTGHATIRNNFVGGASGGERVALRATDVTVAERLRRAGYRTALIGKWGLGEPETSAAPWRKGWDFFYGFVNQAHAHNQYPEFLYRDATPEPLPANFSHKQGVFANDRFTDEALAFLGRAAAAAQPFYLFLSYTTPHSDLTCPPDSIAAVQAENAWARAPDAPESSVTFAAMVHRLDRDVGRVLDRLAELGLARDTLVLFTSDNGAHQEDGKDNAFFRASGPFRGIKRDLTEGGIRVPFFARWPARIPAGATSDHVLAFWDFPATAVELAGQPRPADLPAESVSFAPTLLGRPADQRTHDFLYWEILIKNQARQAVREGNWKLVRYGLDRPAELYDLAADPGETTDLAARQPAVAARLLARLAAARTENPDFPLAAGKPADRAKPAKKPKP
jgi:arylsulfatase A-like enzyme